MKRLLRRMCCESSATSSECPFLTPLPPCISPAPLGHDATNPLPDTIVAGGGDGTLNELVAALLRPPGSALLTEGPTTTIAQLPLGTANDLASASGISLVGANRQARASLLFFVLRFVCVRLW